MSDLFDIQEPEHVKKLCYDIAYLLTTFDLPEEWSRALRKIQKGLICLLKYYEKCDNDDSIQYTTKKQTQRRPE